ncbi:MAG: hypothetical protein M3Z64_07815 [Verrucomicrobiota bacterium]|nr:hypothetical protein [Verrucomicrobiota bacterium]
MKIAIRITITFGFVFAAGAIVICGAALMKRPITGVETYATPCLILGICCVAIAMALSSMLRKREKRSEP